MKSMTIAKVCAAVAAIVAVGCGQAPVPESSDTNALFSRTLGTISSFEFVRQGTGETYFQILECGPEFSSAAQVSGVRYSPEDLTGQCVFLSKKMTRVQLNQVSDDWERSLLEAAKPREWLGLGNGVPALFGGLALTSATCQSPNFFVRTTCLMVGLAATVSVGGRGGDYNRTADALKNPDGDLASPSNGRNNGSTSVSEEVYRIAQNVLVVTLDEKKLLNPAYEDCYSVCTN